MKQTLLFLLLSSPFFASTQTYQLLPDSCTFCMYLHSDGGVGWWSNYYHVDPGQDTVLLGNTYMRLKSGDFNQPFGLRQEGNKLYGVVEVSTDEQLLMDFDAQVGDTIMNLYSEGIYYDAIVNEKDSIQVNGGVYHAYMKLKGIRYRHSAGEEWVDYTWYFEWNEKAICKEDGGVVFNVPYWLYVISTPYAWPDYCTTDPAYGAPDPDVSCDNCIPWTSSLDEYETIRLEIAPNPVNDQMTLQTDKPVDLVRILDLNGVQLLEQVVAKTEIQLNVEGLRAGIYFVGVQLGNSWTWKRIVKG